MYNLFLIIILFSFSISDTYSWEDGEGVIFGSDGNLIDAENVGETDGIAPFDGDRMLTVSEFPIDGTPEAYIGWVSNLNNGDEVTACFYGYDDTEEASPSLRIWGHWSSNESALDDQQSAGGNTEYTDGSGWSQVCHTWTASTFEALTIQARLYSGGSTSTKYFIDKLEINTSSDSAVINFPEPIEGLFANAGANQTVDAGAIVTLDGSGSLNTDGDIIAYLWEQTSGIAVDLDDEESMTTTFFAPDESTVLNFDLTIYDADANESSDSVTITVVSSAGTLSISDIQGEGADSPYIGQNVTTSGYVTARAEYGFFIQDAEASWSGIWILDYGNQSVNIGDEVEVTGMVEEYYNLTEIDVTSGNVSVLSTGNPLYNPILIDSVEEAYESVLVTVSGVCDGAPNEYGEWTLSGIWIDDLMYEFTPVVGEPYTITGPLYYSYDEYKVEPRDVNDVQDGILSNSELIQDFSILNAYPNPFNPTLTIEFSTLSTELIEISVYDLLGQKIDVLYNGLSQANILNNITWNAYNYSSGDYFIYLKTDNFTKTHKITLIK